mgnify:FL=1
MKWEILGAADEMQLDFPKLNLYTNHGSERKHKDTHVVRLKSHALSMWSPKKLIWLFLLWEKVPKTIEKLEILTHLSTKNWTPREIKKKKKRNVEFWDLICDNRN